MNLEGPDSSRSSLSGERPKRLPFVRIGLRAIIAWTSALAATQAALAAAHSLELLLAATFAYGISASLFSVTVISTLQARTRDGMRGRVMALYAICFHGSALRGGPAFGGVAQWLGISAALCASAMICALLALTAIVVRQVMLRPALHQTHPGSRE
jgi:MFS family permease